MLLGGLALYLGLASALVWGVWPGALLGLAGVALASRRLRKRGDG